MHQPYGLHRFLHRGAEELAAPAAHAGQVVGKLALPVAELGFPFAALPRLQAVLLFELHQRARLHQLVEERRELSAQGGPVPGKVFHQQVRQGLGGGAHPDVGAGLARELADQEHEGAEPGLEVAAGSPVPQLDDGLVKFAQQHAGVQQIGLQFFEQEIRRHHRTERSVGRAPDGFVDDLKLGAQLARHAGAVDGAQGVLPEAPANWEQWVILHQNLVVLAPGADAAAGEVAVDLPGARFQCRLDVVDAVLAFGQDDPPDHRLHVLIRQLHVDPETALETLQGWGAGKRGLSGADEEQAVAEPLAAGFDQVLHDIGAVGALSDVLLHLVKDDDGAGHPAAGSQGLLCRRGELFRGDVRRLRKLGAQRRPGFPFAVCEAGVGGEQCFRDDGAHIQVVQLAPELPACRLDCFLHLVVDAVLLEPEAEARLGVALGEPRGLEHDPEQRQPDAIPGAVEGSGRGVQPLPPPAEGGDFGQQFPHVGRQPGKAPGVGAVLGEGVVRPQEAQHLRQVRLAAAEETADPGRRLLRLTLVADVGFKDANEPAAVLPFADEVLQLEAERAALLFGGGVGNGRDALVQKRDLVGVSLENRPVLHIGYPSQSSCAVIGTAR